MLALAIYARYSRVMTGAWRKTYVVSVVLALYLNVFVGIVQVFRRVPALQALAPTQTEQPFKLAQLSVLAVFVAIGIAATLRFRPPASNVIAQRK